MIRRPGLHDREAKLKIQAIAILANGLPDEHRHPRVLSVRGLTKPVVEVVGEGDWHSDEILAGVTAKSPERLHSAHDITVSRCRHRVVAFSFMQVQVADRAKRNGHE